MLFCLLLALLSLVPIRWIITIPVWLISFALAAVHASNEATAVNRRNGIVVR